MTTTLSTLLNNTMSLITIEQFDEFVDAYPEMEQCYDLRYDSDIMDASDQDEFEHIFSQYFN